MGRTRSGHGSPRVLCFRTRRQIAMLNSIVVSPYISTTNQLSFGGWMDLKKKQKALRLISNGMYIVTARAGTKYGAATVTWLSQASFKPPLIMAAVRPEGSVFSCLSESRHGAVHILGSHQQEIARKFLAATGMKDGKINGEPFIEGTTSAPILKNVLSYVECKVQRIISDGGDHAIVIMEVVNAEHSEDFKPLLVADSPWKYGG